MQANTTIGDETALASDAQAYQDKVAQDAHDAQWAEAQAAHDLATSATDAAETSAAAATQNADDAAAAALYQSQVGGATIVQVKSDADAALTDATLTAGVARQASDADASSIETYSEQESAAYENEVERDAAALAQRQSSDAFAWYTDTDFYYGGGPYSDASTYPSALLLENQAQAQEKFVEGGPGPNGSYYRGSAHLQQNLTDALASDQANQEQQDAGAEYTRDLAADVDDENLSVGEAQIAHDAQYAIAASDQALVDAGAFPLPSGEGQGEGGLPLESIPPSDCTPIMASANYNQLETIGGYAMGPTTATSTSLVGSMFSLGPDMGAPYSGWTGWTGWTASDAPPASSNPANNSNNNPTGGVWGSGGAAPPEAPEILAFVDAGSEADDGGQPSANSGGGGAPMSGGEAGGGTQARNSAPGIGSSADIGQFQQNAARPRTLRDWRKQELGLYMELGRVQPGTDEATDLGGKVLGADFNGLRAFVSSADELVNGTAGFFTHGEVMTFVEGVPQTAAGYFYDAPKEAVQGALQTVLHPIDTGSGVILVIGNPKLAYNAVVDQLGEDSRTVRGQGKLAGSVALMFIPSPKWLELMNKAKLLSRGTRLVAKVGDDIVDIGEAARLAETLHANRIQRAEKLFEGGVGAVQEQFDPRMTELFSETGTGDFQGIWLNRMKRTQFDDADLAIYFQRESHLTGRVVGEELQHAIDFTQGATRERILLEALKRTTKDDIVNWWHRRVFTRLMQNVDANNFGLGVLRPHMDDIYGAYGRVGGNLPLQDILILNIKGLY